jgi:hypothetical protein
MEVSVHFEPTQSVALLDKPLHLQHRATEPLQLERGQANDTVGDREWLEPLADLEDLDELLEIEHRDPRPDVGLERHEAFALELSEGLANRDAARAVLPGDILLPDARPRLDLTADDRVAELARDQVNPRLFPFNRQIASNALAIDVLGASK